jgi:hypothetical protein
MYDREWILVAVMLDLVNEHKNKGLATQPSNKGGGPFAMF